MMRTTILLLALCLPGFRGLSAQDAVLPPGDPSPRLRLETGGPRSYISGLAFSADGRTLYSTGWDKAVQVWNRNDEGVFEFSSGAALRVPTGAGLYGGLNGLALSPDGQWLATAGQGYPQGVSGERETGWVLPAAVLSEAGQLDEGLIYVFNTGDRSCRLLRGHRGPVQSLTFVQGSRSAIPELISVAEERTDAPRKLHAKVRVWDVVRGGEVAILENVPGPDGKGAVPLPGLQGFRPGLTAWSMGATPRDLRVALAWGDAQLRVWEVGTGRVLSAPSNPNLLAVLPLAASGKRLLTGAHAEVGVWSLPESRTAAITRQHFQSAAIPSVNGQVNHLLSALCLIPAGQGTEPRLAGMVTQYLEGGRAAYRLVLASTNPVKSVRELALNWTGENRQPAVAASPDGRLLALAGNARNEIEICRVEDLLADRYAPVQRLASSGLAIRKASFVRKGDDWGLRLTELAAEGIEPRSLISNFRSRKVEPDSPEWQAASSRSEGWTAEPSPAGSLSIRRPGGAVLKLTLDDDHIPTAFAYCPPSNYCEFPLVAVASQQRGQPLLQIYRADTAEPVRWCVAHTERIRSLSFSEDGRMLASTADDRTTCVWTVTDLTTRTIGRRGRLPDVIVHSREQKTTVSAAPNDSPLKAGDEVVTVTRSGEPVPVNSAKEFYQHVLERIPGESIEVAVRRGGQVQKLSCEVRQAIDEVKPLFSLFVAESARPDQWQWIGWHPLGSFDAEGDDIDRWLGWHFNTGEPAQPARFAAIGEYRDDFFHPALLQNLIDEQKLVVESGKEEPRLIVWLRYADGTAVPVNLENIPQVAFSDVELVAEVSGVSERSLKGVQLQVDGGDPIPLQTQGGKEWTSDLSKVTWSRGRRRLAVTLLTAEREIVDQLRVEYRPAAPVVEWEQSFPEETKSGEVRINAQVAAASEPVQVQLLLSRPGKLKQEVIRTWETSGTLKIEESVPIEPGDNRIELVSWNVSAPETERDRETAQLARVVRRATPPQAPRLILESVETVSEGAAAIPLAPEQNAYHTGGPQVRIRGKISAQTLIERASITVGEAERDLQRFPPNQVQDFEFDETLTIEPGSHMVALRAAIGDASDEKRLTLQFNPAAPAITSFTAASQSLKPLPESFPASTDRLIEGYHSPTVEVTAVLAGELGRSYELELLSNDERLPESAVKIDRSQPGQHRVRASVPLARGRNAIAIRVSNEWQRTAVSRLMEIDYLTPPEFVDVEGAATLSGEPLRLVSRIRSRLPLRSATITIDDTVAFRDFVLRQDEDNRELWWLEAERIGLAAGEHRLVLQTSNDDGPALQPAVHVVRMEQSRIEPPRLRLITPAAGSDHRSTSRRFEVQTAVESEVETELLIRIRGKSDVLEQRIANHRRDGVPVTTVLELPEGVSSVELQALSSGGYSEPASFGVACVPSAASVELTAIGDVAPRLRNDGSGFFDKPVTKSVVPLRGRVVMRDGSEPGKNLSARIWVNNYMLPTTPVTLDPTDPSLGHFETDVVLSRRFQNEIKVEVFSTHRKIASQVGDASQLQIDCTAPEQKQDLYLLLIGAGDAQLIRDGARTVLQARSRTRQQAAQELWESDAFSRIYVHEAMNAPPAAVQSRLFELTGKMNANLRQSSQGNMNAIVMVYYQGQITLLDDDFAFGGDENTRSRSRITGRILEDNLSRSYGAHLVCLNLQQGAGSRIEPGKIWPKAPHLGIFVSNWKGEELQPRETELMSVLERALPRTRVVKDLAQQMDQQYSTAAASFPGLIETLDLLSPVYDLQIGSLE